MTTSTIEQFRAVARGSLKTVAVGTAAELKTAIHAQGLLLREVALYTSLTGPLEGLLHVDTLTFLAERAAKDAGVEWDVVHVSELREGDPCLTRQGNIVAFLSAAVHGFEGSNAADVCGTGTLAKRVRGTVPEVEAEKREHGEDGISVETVIVTERNIAGQVVREVEVQRTFESGYERQTTVRVEQFDTLSSYGFEVRAADPLEARRYIADCEERELLSKAPAEPVGHWAVMEAAAMDERTSPAAREHAVRAMLEHAEGRLRLMRRRADLAASAALAVGSGNDAARLLRSLSDFDGLLHVATGVVSSSGRVRSRSTGEMGEVISWDRDALGSPNLDIRWADGSTGTLSLIDAEGIS